MEWAREVALKTQGRPTRQTLNEGEVLGCGRVTSMIPIRRTRFRRKYCELHFELVELIHTRALFRQKNSTGSW